jgi:glucosamine--fructose-6-phosphate aminotransferase (isomerizing)
MCGIIAYTGKRLCKDIVLSSLSRLEYRGYDSAGFTCIDTKSKRLNCLKEAGGIAPIKRLIENVTFNGYTGMGHTRWATHGAVDTINAHPHLNCQKNIAVIHNGIIEGHENIREQLLNLGHSIVSATDTELAAHLFTDELEATLDLKTAAMNFASKIRGAFAFIFLLEQYPDTIVALRHRSPMVIGLADQEAFAVSDLVGLPESVRNVVFMPDDSFAFIRPDGIELYSFTGKPLAYSVQEIDQHYVDADKSAFEHFMLKEIYEQKRAISRTLAFCKMLGNPTQSSLPRYSIISQKPSDYSDAIWRQLGLAKEQIFNLRYINLVSTGTSWHAARIAQFFFETICKIPARVYLASEFRYMPLFAEPNSIYLFISQSGETVDTLEALRLVNTTEMHTIAITNVASSSMVREAGGFLPTQAGPEISVASTKAFSTQLVVLYWLAHRIALERGTILPQEMHMAEEQISIAAEILEGSIESYKFAITQKLAADYARYDRFIFLGRHISYPFALEAGLKLKEVSFLFAQSYPAGELKHGPIGLIDEKTPVFIFSILDNVLYQKLLSNALEIKAHGGRLTVFAFEGQDELINLADVAFIIPQVAPLLAPLAMTGVMQFLIYQITRQLGRPIDRPRHSAKPVTIE